MNDLCNDNRFELIERRKKELIDATNIETAQDEMAVIDNILFRFWQMGWLDKLELPSAQPEQTDCEYCHEDSDGYVRSIEKNSHAWLVRRGKVMKLRVGFKGEYRECDILFCPMCGRRLTDG